MKKVCAIFLCLVLCVLNACAKSNITAKPGVTPIVSVSVQSPKPVVSSPAPVQTPAASQTASPTSSASEQTSVEADYTFKGENEDWQCTYHVWGTVIYRNADNVWVTGTIHDQFTATYKKDLSKLSKVKKIGIKCDYGTGSSETNESYDKYFFKNNTYTTGHSGNFAVPSKDATVRATITLDNRKQVIELRAAG